jgi:lipopolysaccharide export LptBFGC system permease protein LptF
MDEAIETTDSLATGANDAGENIQSQEETKTFTQEEVNAIVTKRLQQAQRKFDGVDIDEYQQLKQLKERVEEQELMDRKDFDTLLKKTKDKYEAELGSLKGQLESIKIDGALIDAAGKLRSVAPEQTAQLLRNSVRLDKEGNVVIMDGDNIRYTDEAEPMTVEQLVEEFLSKNSYFRQAGPSGADSSGNADIAEKKSFDLSQLDLHNPDHRAMYAKMKREGKI